MLSEFPLTPIKQRSDPSQYAQTVTVAISGGDFNSICAAVASITDATSVKQYAVLIHPGTYTEAPCALKNYVDIIAVGSSFSTKVIASDINSPLFTGAGLNKIVGLTVLGVTNDAAFLVDTAGFAMTVVDCTIHSCKYGMQATGGLGVAINTTTAPLGSMTSMFYANGGDMQVDGCSVQGNANITTYGHCDSASDLHIINFTLYAPSIVTCFLAEGASEIELMTGFIKGATTAIKTDGASTIVAGNVIIEDSVTTHIEIADMASVVHFTSGRMNRDNMTVVDGYQDGILVFVDNKEGDEAFAVWGELAVGRPELGKESVFGGGDSYTRGMLAYTYAAIGAVYTDVSTAARSASGSTFTFPAIAQHNAIYVASSLANGGDYLQHFGIKASISTALVPGAGRIAVEYWNGGAWVEIDHMSTLSNSPYTQYADHIFERTGSEQIRLPTAFLASWAKNDPMTLGTSYYWIRYRVATAVTTVPVFEQFKLHTSRFEVNADGVTEYFGAARYPKDILMHQRLSDDLSGSSPANQTINYASGISLSLVDNSFNNNTIDGFGGILVVPTGLDTSIPLVFTAGWIPNTNNAGNVELEMETAQIEEGDILNGAAAVVNVPVVVAVNNQQDELHLTSFSIDVNELQPGSLLAYRLFRDATGGNAHDTLVGNAEIASWRAFGTFWRP